MRVGGTRGQVLSVSSIPVGRLAARHTTKSHHAMATRPLLPLPSDQRCSSMRCFVCDAGIARASPVVARLARGRMASNPEDRDAARARAYRIAVDLTRDLQFLPEGPANRDSAEAKEVSKDARVSPGRNRMPHR